MMKTSFLETLYYYHFFVNTFWETRLSRIRANFVRSLKVF